MHRGGEGNERKDCIRVVASAMPCGNQRGLRFPRRFSRQSGAVTDVEGPPLHLVLSSFIVSLPTFDVVVAWLMVRVASARMRAVKMTKEWPHYKAKPHLSRVHHHETGMGEGMLRPLLPPNKPPPPPSFLVGGKTIFQAKGKTKQIHLLAHQPHTVK